MQNLQRHAPEMKEIQRKFKHDKKKMNEELMKFYKENQHQPGRLVRADPPPDPGLHLALPGAEALHLGHELPAGGQPRVARADQHPRAGERRLGPLLLVIYIGSQLASTYFMSATVDRTQRLIFFALPFLFIPFVIHFKAGLVLYWATTNLWTVGQGIVTRRLVPRTKVAPPKKSSRTPPRGEARGQRREGDGARARSPRPAAAAEPAPPQRVKRKKKRSARR